METETTSLDKSSTSLLPPNDRPTTIGGLPLARDQWPSLTETARVDQPMALNVNNRYVRQNTRIQTLLP